MKGVSFDSYEVARAAFALGPVRFRCLVCGRTHSSDSFQDYRLCWNDLLEEDCITVPDFAPKALRELRPNLMLWMVLNREKEAAEYYWLRWRLEEITTSFGMLSPAEAPPCCLALTNEAFSEFTAEHRRKHEKSAKAYEEKIACEAELIRARYPALKELFKRPDQSIFPVEFDFRRCEDGTISSLKSITFGGRRVVFKEKGFLWLGGLRGVPFGRSTGYRIIEEHAEDVYWESLRPGMRLVWALEDIFHMSNIMRNWSSSIAHYIYDIKLEPYDCYFSVVRHSMSSPKAQEEYFILRLAGYEKPEVLGVIKDKKFAMLDRALERLEKFGSDIPLSGRLEPCLL